MAKRVLFIVADDMGIEQSTLYGANGPGLGTAATPNIDALHTGGIKYSRFYVNAFCSPTRGAYLTGRYPFRTGVGNIIEDDVEQPLLNGELTIMELLKEQLGARNVTCWGAGKWHLGNAQDGGLSAPNFAGFDYFAGTVRNLPPTVPNSTTWYNFDYMVQGEQRHQSGQYATEWTADRAIEMIRRLGDTKWFGYLPFHAPHEPFHRPPLSMFNNVTWVCPDPEPRKTPGNPIETQTGDAIVPYFKASQEALDFQIGRVLAAIPASLLAETLIIFISDNGTTAQILGQEFYPDGSPYDGTHGKREAYEPGIHCLLAVKGGSVDAPGRTVTSLVSVVDLYSTIAEYLGCTDIANYLRQTRNIALDSVSFLPNILDHNAALSRTMAWSEIFGPNGANLGIKSGNRAMVNNQYKLYWRNTNMNGVPKFFDLVGDPKELTDLLVAVGGNPLLLPANQKVQYDALYSAALALLRST